jgi:UDP-galactopyranose mutase
MVILHVGHVAYETHHHRALFEAYARRVRTLYLEMRDRAAGDAGGGIAAGATPGGVEVVRIEPRLPGGRFAWIARRNWSHGVRAQVAALRSGGATDVVLSVQTPGTVPTLAGLGADLTSYLIVDDYAGLAPAGERAGVERAHQRLLRDADLVWAVSTPLLEAARRVRPDARPTSTGVDHAAFADAAARSAAPAVAALPRPRIGMAGNLNDRIDWELLEGIARARRDWSLVIVGPLHRAGAATARGVERLRRLANAHLLPGVAPGDLPGVIAGFDVGLVIYRPGEGTLGINPLKLYQYLAAGKPVVATPLPVFAQFADVVRIAADTPALVRAIDAALAQDAADPHAAEARRRRALPFDWDAIAVARLEVMQAALAGGWNRGGAVHKV